MKLTIDKTIAIHFINNPLSISTTQKLLQQTTVVDCLQQIYIQKVFQNLPKNNHRGIIHLCIYFYKCNLYILYPTMRRMTMKKMLMSILAVATLVTA